MPLMAESFRDCAELEGPILEHCSEVLHHSFFHLSMNPASCICAMLNEEDTYINGCRQMNLNTVLHSVEIVLSFVP